MDESPDTLLGLKRYQNQKRLLHFQALWSDMKFTASPPGELERDNLVSSAQSLQVTGIELLEDGNTENGKEALKNASELYEHLSSIDNYSEEIRLEFLLLAAITSSLADYQANAYVLSNKLPQELVQLSQGLRDSYSIFSILAILILRRQLGPARNYITEQQELLPTREQLLIDRLESQDDRGADPLIDGWRFLCLKFYLRGCGQFIDYLETGVESAFEQSAGLFNRILEIFHREGDVEYWYIVHAVNALIHRIKERSIWSNIYAKLQNPFAYQYCQNLIFNENQNSLFELWPSQIKAISKGILDAGNENVIVHLPTSAGKTRIAELAILTSLNFHPEKLCIYIAPFRALVEDVQNSLDSVFVPLGFRVAPILGGAEFVDDEEQVTQLVNVLIVTPEKLDLILRRWPETLSKTGLIIFDEGHIISEGSRGLRSEFLLSRLLRQSELHGYRVVFMSAMVPNPEDLQSFLNVTSEYCVSDEWRPNRQLVGKFKWFNKQNRPDKNGEYGRVTYFQGSDIFFPRIIERKHYSIEETPKAQQLSMFGNMDRPKKKIAHIFPKTSSDTQATLALRYMALGPVLIFSSTKRKAGGVCKSLSQGIKLTKQNIVVDSEQKHALERLEQQVSKYLGNHPLTEYIKEGFATHHADFPEAVRALVEAGFRDGHLRILVATSTLAQGVNLPIKTVIVGSLVRGKNDYVSIRDYKNVIGRAGRANFETEGNIILCHERLPNEVANKYSNTSPTIENITSQIWGLWENLVKQRITSDLEDISFNEFVKTNQIPIPILDEDNNVEMKTFSQIDTTLFTVLIEETFDPDDENALLDVLGTTLFGSQCAIKGVDYRPIAAFLSARQKIIQSKFLIPELQQAYYQTGLSLSSCHKIIQIIEEEKPQCVEKLFTAPITEEVISELVRIAIRSGFDTTLNTKTSQTIEIVLPHWLNGLEIREILKTNRVKKLGIDEVTVCDVAYKHIARTLSWGVSGVIHLALNLFGIKNPGLVADTDQITQAQLIPAYLKYGVNTKPAVWARLLGVQNRPIAIQLGKEYLVIGATPSLESFTNWFLNLNYPELLQILDNEQAALELLTEQVNVSMQDANQRELVRAGLNALSLTVKVWRSSAFLGYSPEIRVKHDYNNPDPNNMAVFSEDNTLIGYIARNTSVWLVKLPQNYRIAESTYDFEEDLVSLRIEKTNSNLPV